MSRPSLQRLGRYELLEELGRGGFAVVYRALDTVLQAEVALKVLKPGWTDDPKAVDRFLREARQALRLKHPNIVSIYHVDQAEGRLFIAMELVPGRSLAQLVTEEGPMGWEAALPILEQAAAALDYAHEHGLIHRDIKPANILLDESSTHKTRHVVLTDFGLVRGAEQASMTGTMSGGIVGTPEYIPPEVWEGQPASTATDVYALACVAYYLMTGDQLFMANTTPAVMKRHLDGAIFTTHWPESLPAGISTVLMKALARDPMQRPRSAGELMVNLRQLTSNSTASGIEIGSPSEGLISNEGMRSTDRTAAAEIPSTTQWQPMASDVTPRAGAGAMTPNQPTASPSTPMAPLATPATKQAAARRSVWLLPVAAATALVVLAAVFGISRLRTAAPPAPPMPTVVVVVVTATSDAHVSDATNTPLPTNTAVSTSTAPPSNTYTSTSTPLPDAIVASASLNLRAGPGEEFDIIGNYLKGEALRVVGKNTNGKWVQVTTGGGRTGWMLSSLLNLNINLTTVPVAAAPPTPTRPAPTNQIAFSSNRDGAGDIYIMNSDGTSQRRLTTLSVDSRWPAWHPSGSSIAFHTQRGNEFTVYVMNADGSDVRVVVEDAGSAAWTSNGRQMSYDSDRSGNPEIYVVNTDGSTRNLTQHPAADSQSSWSPDGRKVAFVSDRDGNREVYVMNSDGTGPLNLTRQPADDMQPAWSPDGRSVAFQSKRDGNWEIYVMNADGSDVRNLTRNRGWDSRPMWSPDGRLIVFCSDRIGNWEVYVMNADGSDVRNLTNNPADDSGPAWSPR